MTEFTEYPKILEMSQLNKSLIDSN